MSMQRRFRPAYSYSLSALCLLLFIDNTAGAAQEPPVDAVSWPEELGNHRFHVLVPKKADAVRVRIEWRRRDTNPENKAIIILDAQTREQIDNAVRVEINREVGDIIFQPRNAPGEVEVYMMPYRREGPHWFFTAAYLQPEDKPDPAWLERNGLTTLQLAREKWNSLPEAEVLRPEARSGFHRFSDMELIATAEETNALTERHAQDDYLLYPEDRKHSIRMMDDLPFRWIERGPSREFSTTAQPGEYLTFQIGVFPHREAVKDIAVTFSDLESAAGTNISSQAFCCFNTGGTDWLGRPFEKEVSVAEGKVGALWFGIDIPKEITEGVYKGELTLHAGDMANMNVDLELIVRGPVLDDAGDADLSRLSRLRWLNSKIGIDDGIVAPYTPLEITENSVACLGRTVRLASTGFPSSIQSGGNELLSTPIQLIVESDGGEAAWTGGSPGFLKRTPGTAIWESASQSGNLTLHCRAKMEFDGYLNYQATVRAAEDTTIEDIRLEIPLRRETATYMMGMGRKGGYRPSRWPWKWDEAMANNSLWLGDVDAGLHCKLKSEEDAWNLYQLGPDGVPESWSNGGKGGCDVIERGPSEVVIRAYSGERVLRKGDELAFCFGLLITPVKPIAPGHWNQRYYHQYAPVDTAVEAGARIINIHHGNELNPFINYPFRHSDKLAAYVQEAHNKDAKVKIYYTVRELSNYVAEMWALRSLGDEIFTGGYGGAPVADHFAEDTDKKRAAVDEDESGTLPGGDSWLREHLVDHYTPAWHHSFPDGVVDAAIATTGLSRWHNYYLEGLRWLLENVEIDGLYLDGIGYDREIMKRVRKVMDRTRPGCLIDFHSGNNFHPQYGLSNCANQYMEHFPYLDSLWLGEGFDYNESPDYWLVEVSGIPFGLMSEMLQEGGNPWRGMIYGMTNRLPWSGDPREIWKLWDEFGIEQSRMIGYWDADCPVKTDHADVLATVYQRPERALISIASWVQDPVEVKLEIDWEALGLDSDKTQLHAHAMPDFQEAATFAHDAPIPISPGRGWLLVLEEAV